MSLAALTSKPFKKNIYTVCSLILPIFFTILYVFFSGEYGISVIQNILVTITYFLFFYMGGAYMLNWEKWPT